MELESTRDVAARLGETGYLCDESLATVTYLALRMQRPLLLEGEPGTGKTALAEALAESLDLPLVRLQCYEGIDATQALYDWDFPRQILHLRALEAAGETVDVDKAESSLFDERFLLSRRGRRRVQRRLGAWRHRPAARADAPPARARSPGRLGEPPRGQGRLPARAAGNRGRPRPR